MRADVPERVDLILVLLELPHEVDVKFLKASLENIFFVVHVLVNDLTELLVLSHEVVLIQDFSMSVFQHVLALLPKYIEVFLAIY